MAKRISTSDSSHLDSDQKSKLAKLSLAKDSHGRLRMQTDPEYRRKVETVYRGQVGSDDQFMEEVQFEDSIHDIDRKLTAITGFEELQKEQAREEVKNFLQSD